MDDRDAYLVDRCRGRRVLHVGCADALYLDEKLENGTLLHRRLGEVASHLVGVDIDRSAIQRLKEEGFREVYVADVEQMDVTIKGDFDVVVAGELIEHLNNPGLFLTNIGKFLRPSGEIIITTPNLLNLKAALWVLFGKQRVHEDHSLGFTFSMLEELLQRHGVESYEFLVDDETHCSRLNSLANFLLAPVYRAWPEYSDTIIVRASLMED